MIMATLPVRTAILTLAGLIFVGLKPLQVILCYHTPISSFLVKFFLKALALGLSLFSFYPHLRTPSVYIWNCFFRPFLSRKPSGDHREHLDAFYQGQADVYDSTRPYILKGREMMLQLMASHLNAQPVLVGSGLPKKKIWVDIGGGTGWNIEVMDQYLPISTFDAVYLIDLCEPLLAVARKRFAKRGWKNVHVLCQDASRFVLPEWESGEVDPRGSVSVITLSYSLSMIPTFYPLLDRCDQVLDPQQGLIGVVDFYTSRDSTSTRERAIGTASKRVSWFSKWFWECFFHFDNIHLHASRRDYLEYKMGTIKSYNARNNFLGTWFISIPYYVFLGCSRQRDATAAARAFQVEAGNKIGQGQGGLITPVSPFFTSGFPSSNSLGVKSSTGGEDDMPDLSLGPSVLGETQDRGSKIWSPGHSRDQTRVEMEGTKKGVESDGMALVVKEQTIYDMGAPLSPFHYQLRKAWRVPYLEEKIHEQFKTHIYGWTWEDPRVDVERLGITKDDSILAITSAGDNVLHYAIAAGVERIHAVDMNPCQGHILELKLAAIQALEYSDFWKIFGEGRHPDFDILLTTKIAPFLSSHAFAYWKTHSDQFSNNFHLQGFSGWALRIVHFAFAVAGVSDDVKRLCKASTTMEQNKIWTEKLRPVFLNKFVCKFFLANPLFTWRTMGVPKNQVNCFLGDGSVEDFVKATLDPIPLHSTLKDTNYHYFLCLNGHYTPASCPLYLKPEGFQALKDAQVHNVFKLHTDTILNVLRGLEPESLTKIIVMDSLDWFDPIPPSTPLPLAGAQALDELDDNPEAAYEHLKSELDHEILEMRRVLKSGGIAVWRSAAKYPWYRQRFGLAGFKVRAIDIRGNGKAIDAVNMYASLWRAEKL
ncbi:hypothetical protein FRB93_006827 [Tulasnella sp. JGI-2019a]|nr:hypothetical protein FRB93_006827 [Tulasnella sp. JGI-2019a]